MRYGNRSLWKRMTSSPFAAVILIFLLIFLARAVWTMHQKSLSSAATLAQAQSELARLKERQADLSAKVSRLSTEQGVEAEMRGKYHAVKEGESVAIIVDDAAATDTPPATTTPQIGWWRRLLRGLGL